MGHTSLDMNFQFQLGGVPLEANEAAALLSMNKTGSSSPTMIDLESVIDSEALDAGKLFEMAVSKQDESLASLAWKISVQQKDKKVIPVKKEPKFKVITGKPSDTKSLEEIIEHLNNSSSYSSLGAAMILKAASEKEWVTLRTTAIGFANKMWADSLNKKGLVLNYKMLRGFELQNGSLEPVHLSSGVKRKDTFHVSPMYIALREGLLFCKKQDLVIQKNRVSIGAPYSKGTSKQADSTRRIYYSIKATERGHELLSMWADIDRYIDKTLVSQVAS